MCLHYRFVCVSVAKVDPTYSLPFLLQINWLEKSSSQDLICDGAQRSAFLKGVTVSPPWAISNAGFKTLLKWFGSDETSSHAAPMTSEALRPPFNLNIDSCSDSEEHKERKRSFKIVIVIIKKKTFLHFLNSKQNC